MAVGSLQPTFSNGILDDSGDPLAFGLVYFFAAGTSTPLAAYKDSTLITPHTHPMVLDGNGRAPSDGVYFSATGYKVRVETATGTLVWEQDNWQDIGQSQLAASQVFQARSQVFNIDNGAGVNIDDVIMRLSRAVTLSAARIVYVDAATGTVAAGSAQVGTTVGGSDLVAPTNYQNGKAVGSVTNMTLAATAVAANQAVHVRHIGVAATQAGQAYVEIEYS